MLYDVVLGTTVIFIEVYLYDRVCLLFEHNLRTQVSGVLRAGEVGVVESNQYHSALQLNCLLEDLEHQS